MNEVIDALVDPAFYYLWINQATPDSIPTHADAYSNPKLAPLTRNCLGALDGSHIPCTPPASECAPFRNRKGTLSLNVLGAVTFDGLFCYVYAGWEGSANDSRVLKDAMQRGGLKIAEGWNYLADAGYGMGEHLLVPCRGVRYHLREIGIAKQRYDRSSSRTIILEFTLYYDWFISGLETKKSSTTCDTRWPVMSWKERSVD